ncbi:MAG TPA: Fic family protein [Clostridia bacterium]
MSNFFDQYELYTEGDSVYCYKGTGVLKNKLGIKDSKLLKDAESELVFAALLELGINPIHGKFDKKHLYDIHEFMFNNCYDFAGKTRKEDISKGGTKFCVWNYIDDQLEELFSKASLKKTKVSNRNETVEFLGYLMAELNIIHPFREGNGRAIREYIREYALSLGFSIDWSKIDKELLLDAMIESVFDSADLKKCLHQVMIEI